jgi:hypothetical protein
MTSQSIIESILIEREKQNVKEVNNGKRDIRKSVKRSDNAVR